MNVWEWFAIGLACFYGAISAWGGIMQFRLKIIPLWAAAGMLVSGISLLAAGAVIIATPSLGLLMIPGLVLLHILALVNGIHMYGQIRWSHYMIRLVLSSIIAILLLG